MKKVLLMRHAKSSWDNPSLRDHDRALNDRGKKDALRMGELLNEKDIIPEVILCSTAKRARKTAKGVRKTAHFEGQIEYVEDLYHGDTDVYIDLLNNLDDRMHTAMIIGHNPEMNGTYYHFTGVNEHLATASVTVLEFDIEHWRDLTMELDAKSSQLYRPRDLE